MQVGQLLENGSWTEMKRVAFTPIQHSSETHFNNVYAGCTLMIAGIQLKKQYIKLISNRGKDDKNRFCVYK